MTRGTTHDTLPLRENWCVTVFCNCVDDVDEVDGELVESFDFCVSGGGRRESLLNRFGVEAVQLPEAYTITGVAS